MSKNIILALTLLMSITSAGLAGAAPSGDVHSADGAEDLIEAYGGSRSGGDC